MEGQIYPLGFDFDTPALEEIHADSWFSRYLSVFREHGAKVVNNVASQFALWSLHILHVSVWVFLHPTVQKPS